MPCRHDSSSPMPRDPYLLIFRRQADKIFVILQRTICPSASLFPFQLQSMKQKMSLEPILGNIFNRRRYQFSTWRATSATEPILKLIKWRRRQPSLPTWDLVGFPVCRQGIAAADTVVKEQPFHQVAAEGSPGVMREEQLSL